jgi:hypothetical protein
MMSAEENRHRLFVYELRSLTEAMRAAKSPFADRLHAATNRFLLDAEGDEAAADPAGLVEAEQPSAGQGEATA